MTPAQIEQALRVAIAGRRLVQMTYSGAPKKVAPHALFYSTGGQLLLHGWLVPDAPADSPQGGKNFDLRHVSEAHVTDAPFTPDTAFDPAARRFRYGMVCSVG